ncbi:tyrosine-type recombinase/integrase [Brevundimonas sp.]|uniref:tyrosine-type recombinase/integrase n=1 Tax=Brevundimonas sp. TaxID=1871086 RepID=UPI0035AF2D5D
MSRRSKGPRLYLRAGRVHARTGQPIPDVYYIRDGQTEVSTGCGPDRLEGAEQALAEYIASKWSPSEGAAERTGDPASIYVAEIAALYLQEKAPRSPDPVSLRGRFASLLEFWGDKTLADVRRSTCQAYVAWRTAQPIKSFTKSAPRMATVQAARRDLEDLSAAIGYWEAEHPLLRRPKVTLPEKPESPRDALSRQQAALLLLAAMGWYRTGEGKWKRRSGSARANRAHLRRFILIGLYTGTRPGVIPKLLWHESPTQAWVDLETGTVYRRGRDEKDHRTKRRPLARMPRRLQAHMERWAAVDALGRETEEGREPITTVLHHGGRPLAGKIRRGFESCVRDAGLPEDVTPHWMRHTCATWLMEAGVPVWDAAAYTGMTTATLERCYGHHRPDHQNRARQALGGRR